MQSRKFNDLGTVTSALSELIGDTWSRIRIEPVENDPPHSARCSHIVALTSQLEISAHQFLNRIDRKPEGSLIVYMTLEKVQVQFVHNQAQDSAMKTVDMR